MGDRNGKDWTNRADPGAVPKPTEEQKSKASRVVAANALGFDDCTELLDMLGLLEDPR